MDQPRHVILITTDQQRADMCGREGFGVDCTPTMDALGEDGVWFDRAYTSAPLCVPARISLLTGRYPSATGIRENPMTERPRYTSDLFDVMRAAGYRTAMLGKNHSHLTADRVDKWAAYNHFGRAPRGSDAEHADFDAWLRDLGMAHSMEATPFDVSEQMPVRLVDQSIAWLDENRAGRSFQWLSIPEPHVPFQVSEPYFSQYSPDVVPPPETTADDITHRGFVWQHLLEVGAKAGETTPDALARARASYVGMIRLIDDQLARLVAHLREQNLLDDTLLIFTSDHGEFAGEYGLLRKGGELSEVLTRVPMVFSGGGVPSGGLSSGHVSIVDIMPTLCELVGASIPVGVQGRSLVGLLDGSGVPDREFGSVYSEQGFGELPYTEDDLRAEGGRQIRENGAVFDGVGTLDGVVMSGTRRMVRSGRWKLVSHDDGRLELYDLEADRYELANRAGDPSCAKAQQEMTALLAAWMTRTADPLPIPDGGFRRKRHPRNYVWT